ncbi:MAG: hypothetical protein WC593_04260 [Methanoregula sp.]
MKPPRGRPVGGGGTCEIFIHAIDDTLGRRFDADVGLNVFDL